MIHTSLLVKKAVPFYVIYDLINHHSHPSNSGTYAKTVQVLSNTMYRPNVTKLKLFISEYF